MKNSSLHLDTYVVFPKFDIFGQHNDIKESHRNLKKLKMNKINLPTKAKQEQWKQEQ